MIFKKKPIYIVGIILFTLILIADLAIFFLVPTAGNRGDRPGMGGGSFNGEMPEGFDSENFDPGSFGGQMPGGENFGDFEGEMPEGFEGFGGQMPNGGEDFTMPEGFDSSNMPNRGQMNNMGGGGFLSAIRVLFWPIAIVCVLGDALCIFMLIRISKKKGNKQEASDDDDDSDNPPRRDRTNTLLAVIAVLLVGAVALTSLPSTEAGNTIEAQISVQEAQASVNDLASVFSGSGTLQNSEVETMELPLAVNVTSYTVKNGDVVQTGQRIANVDKTSVLKAIYEVQSLITEMDAEIAGVQSDTLEDKITARADGRVKAIYVAEGDSVASAMYENGAVMLISLGGSMTVVIESDQEVTVGEILTVTLSDETKIEGKVQQVRSGKITVTTTDDGPTPDDTVSVATEDGTTLGTGTLSISSPLKVTGYFGTVDHIKVDVGDEVETGDTLMTLEDTADLARYQQLLRERKALTELVNELTVMYQEGTIKATTSGVISQIAEDAAYTQLSAAFNSGYHGSKLSASSTASYTVVLLSNTATEPSIAPTEETVPTESTIPAEETPPTESTDPAEETTPAETTPPPDGDTAPPTQTTNGTYAGKVTKVGYGALQIKISATDMTGSTIAALQTIDEALFTITKQYTPSMEVPVNLYQNGQLIKSSINAIQAGDKVLIRIEGGTVSQIDFIVGTGTSGPSQGVAPGGNMQMPSGGGMGGSFGGVQQPNAEDEDEEEAVYEVEKTAVCAIIPAETMTVDISVDELDILSLAVDQEATITLDALPGQSFTGTVKKINPTGTNEGGSTKYTVTVEVPRTEQMLPGMNASVLIEVSRLDRVLTIPAAAVQEDGNRTYVYTALEEKTGQPTNPIDVTTGSSDGTNIEILSGLTSGDTVYYSYADSIVYRFAN